MNIQYLENPSPEFEHIDSTNLAPSFGEVRYFCSDGIHVERDLVPQKFRKYFKLSTNDVIHVHKKASRIDHKSFWFNKERVINKKLLRRYQIADVMTRNRNIMPPIESARVEYTYGFRTNEVFISEKFEPIVLTDNYPATT
jgi:hypothetical protein